jgi:hypothetical protein
MRHRPDRRYAPHHARRRSKDKVRAQNRLGMILIGIGGAAVLAVGIGFAATYHPSDIDKTTGCPRGNQAPAAHTLILVDATDKLAGAQLRNARSVIQTEYMWLPMGGQLTVRSLTQDPEIAKEIVICRLDDGSHASGWDKNPKAVKRQFDQTVGAKLRAFYTDLEAAPLQDASPIMETASATFDRPDFAPNVDARRLIIISDFAQHSGIASDYGRGHRLDEHARDYLARDMSDVEMRLHYVSRPQLRDLQTATHRQFWEDYFNDMGAHAVLGSNLLIGEDPSKDTWIG